MNKNNYQQRNRQFIKFVSEVIKGEININHSYLDDAFLFDTLESAFDSYVFPFSANSKNTYKADPCLWRKRNNAKLFPANKAKLDVIQHSLRQEFAAQQADDSRIYHAIKTALYWGATGEVIIPENTKRQGTYAANVKWIDQNYPDLALLTTNIRNAVREIESTRFDSTQFGKNSTYRMNAGYTKVYALLAQDSIIYDGRVGAALGYLVTLFCQQTGATFTEDLNFHWGASESKNRFRNPSIPEKGWNFSKLSNNDEAAWALCNVKANWILAAAIEQLDKNDTFGGYDKSTMLHAIEAALFMVGYDFPALSTNKVSANHVDHDANAKITKRALAENIFTKHAGKPRQYILSLFQQEANLSAAGAATYYQSIKQAKR